MGRNNVEEIYSNHWKKQSVFFSNGLSNALKTVLLVCNNCKVRKTSQIILQYALLANHSFARKVQDKLHIVKCLPLHEKRIQRSRHILSVDIFDSLPLSLL